MSAALQLPLLKLPRVWANEPRHQPIDSAIRLIRERETRTQAQTAQSNGEPVTTYAFYRKYTENLLRRYLYASMQVGRSPSLLGESVGRGWASSRKVRTFEDAVIFVLDVERCLARLSSTDKQLISRIVLQEYTQAETADLMGMSTRTVCAKFPQALDRLTVMLVESDLLVLPD